MAGESDAVSFPGPPSREGRGGSALAHPRRPARAPLPESRPPARRDDRRVLVVDAAKRTTSVIAVQDVATALAADDVLVVNDAGTLPASLSGRANGHVVEVRLRRTLDRRRFEVCIFGAGDHHTRTEDRPKPTLAVGTEIRFGRGRLLAVVLDLLEHTTIVRFDLAGKDLVLALHALGRPVQYAHVPRPLATWDVQTAYAGAPWAMEMPSAGRAFSTAVLLSLMRKGVAVAALTHAAGLSSVGNEAEDSRPPPAERYVIPERTARLIFETKLRGKGRVIALGTTVVRALESAALADGALVAGAGTTGLALDAESELRVVSGIVSDLHEPGTSHHALLSAVVDEQLLTRAWECAGEAGLRSHELGDLMLVLPP